MNRLTPCQHLNELVDAPGPGFGPLCVSDPVEDGVPIRARQRLEHRLRSGIGTQRSGKVFWHRDTGLPGIRGLPSTVRLRLTHLGLAGSMHSARDNQPFSDGDIPL
jgi:hypothetical protein